jgi:Domain of unknown function (DUF4062)
MAKIYISSTYKDLVEHRASVHKALLSAGHEVRAMEVYLASDERPLGLCRDDVAGCDIYVGIFAWRYGYVPETGNPRKNSITELEYLHAGKARKPRLIFLLDEAERWHLPLTDAFNRENENGQRIAALRQRLEKTHTPARFRSPDHLALQVSLAVQKTCPSTGTIRLTQPWRLDLDALVDAAVERMGDRGLVGLGIPCAEAELLKNFGERLRDLIGRHQAKMRPLQKVDPKYAEQAVTAIGRCRPLLAQHDVICPVELFGQAAAGGDINRRFWRALRDAFAGDLGHRLIVIMGREADDPGSADPTFPEGVIVLPAPEFTVEHVSSWIQEMVARLGWPPWSIAAWRKAMVEGCGRGNSLWIAGVYHHVAFALQLLQGNPTAEEFLAEFQGSGAP